MFCTFCLLEKTTSRSARVFTILRTLFLFFVTAIHMFAFVSIVVRARVKKMDGWSNCIETNHYYYYLQERESKQ